MSLETRIYGITGKSPFDIYICQGNGENCLYIGRIKETSYNFTIPEPYDTLSIYMLKIVDARNFIISGIQEVQ